VIVIAVALVPTCALAVQGLRQHHDADELLAAALYFGYSSTPMLSSLETSAKSRIRGKTEAERRDFDFVWLLRFLYDRDLQNLLGITISQARHPSRTDPLANLIQGDMTETGDETETSSFLTSIGFYEAEAV